MKAEVIRSSILAPYIDGLIEEKHANGYDYASEELILNRFDAYCCRKGLDTTEVSKEFLSEWMERSDTEGGKKNFVRQAAPAFYGDLRNERIHTA